MRLVRTLILLAGGGLLLPSPPADPLAEVVQTDTTAVLAMEMLSSATSAFSDISSFCVRQPDACETAAYVAAHLEAKAKYNARLVYEWATDGEQPARGSAVPVLAVEADPLQTGSFEPARAGQPTLNQSTLRLDDLVPEWRSPAGPQDKG